MKARFRELWERPEARAVLERIQSARYPLLVVLVGIALLCWPSAPAGQQAEPPGADASAGEAYESEALEERLARTLSEVEGVGKAEVVLTVSSLGREVLAQDESRRGEEWNRTTVVLQGSDRQETTVTTERIAPTYQGALVVCEGGGSAAVQWEVKRAVGALTGLGTDRITVCARQGG
jgi:stage III sporulation protein AG